MNSIKWLELSQGGMRAHDSYETNLLFFCRKDLMGFQLEEKLNSEQINF